MNAFFEKDNILGTDSMEITTNPLPARARTGDLGLPISHSIYNNQRKAIVADVIGYATFRSHK
jgi:hypothetical protein